MSERISGADLRLFESAPDYHLARCSRCGVVVVVEKGLDAFACACASLAPPVSVLRGGFTPTHVTTTPTGRRLHEIIDEVRRLRGLVERMDTAIEHSLSEPAGQRVLYLSQASPEFFIEARAIREEQGRG